MKPSLATTALRLRPDQPETHFRVAVCQAHLDRLIEAKSALAECERLCPGFVSMKSTGNLTPIRPVVSTISLVCGDYR